MDEKKKRFTCFPLFALALCASFACALEPEPSASISFTQDESPWPLYSCITDGEWSCILTDMIRTATDRMGAKLTFQFYPESRMVPAVLSRDVDVTTIYTSPYVSKQVYPDSLQICPQLLFTSRYVVFRRKGESIHIDEDIDLHNYRVGILRLGEPLRYRVRGETLRKLTLFNTERQMVKGLLAKRVDLIIMTRLGGIPSLNAFGALDKVDIIFTLTEYNFHYAYAKDAPKNKPILSKLCPTLSQLEADGVLSSIKGKYNGLLKDMQNGDCPLNACLKTSKRN